MTDVLDRGPDYEDWETHRWYLAVIKANEMGDLSPLIGLFRSESCLTPTAMQLIAELLERRKPKLRGKRLSIVERLSEKDLTLLVAHEAYRELKVKRGQRAAAIERIAKEYGIEVSVFENHILGKRGASRRRR